MERMDSRATQVFLHADDFGMNHSVTDGILAGFTHGLLTSTSILANAPAFEYAIAQWRKLENDRTEKHSVSASNRQRLHDFGDVPFDLGVHLNLTQGRPLTANYPLELLDSEGRFPGIGRLFQRLMFAAGRWRNSIRNELDAQIERVISCGQTPTHLNGHQYVELVPGVTELIPELAEQFQISVVRVALESRLSNALHESPRPISNWCLALVKHGFARRFVRYATRHKLGHADDYCGAAHAGHVTFDLLRRFVSRVSHRRSLEIGVHPGAAPVPLEPSEIADGWQDPLGELRPHELKLLQSEETVELFACKGLRLGRLALMEKRT